MSLLLFGSYFYQNIPSQRQRKPEVTFRTFCLVFLFPFIWRVRCRSLCPNSNEVGLFRSPFLESGTRIFLGPLNEWTLDIYSEILCPCFLQISLLACKKAKGSGCSQSLQNLQEVVPDTKLAHQAAILHPYQQEGTSSPASLLIAVLLSGAES